MSTKVVHCKKAKFDVYIGRPGPWGNPFEIGRDGTRKQVVGLYRIQLWADIRHGRVTREQLAELHGKTLGCWCSPQPCHGDVLAGAAAWAADQLEGSHA